MNKLGIEISVPDETIRAMSDKFATAYNLQVSDREYIDSQVICVLEEAGEFAGAYRRYTKRARRSGSYQEMCAELADVIISAIHAAWLLGINDIQAVIDDKVGVVTTRNVKE